MTIESRPVVDPVVGGRVRVTIMAEDTIKRSSERANSSERAQQQ